MKKEKPLFNPNKEEVALLKALKEAGIDTVEKLELLIVLKALNEAGIDTVEKLELFIWEAGIDTEEKLKKMIDLYFRRN